VWFREACATQDFFCEQGRATVGGVAEGQPRRMLFMGGRQSPLRQFTKGAGGGEAHGS